MDCLRALPLDWPREFERDFPRADERDDELDPPREEDRDLEPDFDEDPEVLRDDVLEELALLRWVGMVFPLRVENRTAIESALHRYQ